MVSAKEGAKRVLPVKTERDDFSLYLNDDKVSEYFRAQTIVARGCFKGSEAINEALGKDVWMVRD